MSASTQARCALVLGLGGAFVAWNLSFASALRLAVPCGEDRGCDIVALSPASHFLGIPVAFFGLVAYLILTAVALHRLKTGSGRWANAGFMLSLVGAAISCGLTYYSLKVLNTHCDWCLASNAIMLVTALLYAVVSSKPADFSIDWPRERRFAVAASALTLGAMTAGPLLTLREGRQLTGDATALRATSLLDLTPPDALTFAPHGWTATVVAFVDMQCPDCHEFVPRMHRYAEANSIRLVLRHFPLKRHEHAFPMAVLAQEATMQGKGWPLVLQGFEEGLSSTSEFQALAGRLGIRGNVAVPDPKAEAAVRRDADLARRLKIHLTPTLVVIERGRQPEFVSAVDYGERFQRR